MKILINGALGRMGKEVEAIVNASSHTVAGKVDVTANDSSCLKNIEDFCGDADVIIDFSNHLGTEKLLEFAVKKKIPTVVATTGHTEKEIQIIHNTAKKIPVFYSANMSLGVALLVDLALKTASVMADADIEIVETHHNRKLDAPSGTALMIANALKKVRPKAVITTGRSGNAKRKPDEIGIQSVRRGNIVGIHEVTVSTDNQTITLKHEAHSRALFAEGAVSAAEFLLGKSAGLYDMNSIVKGGKV